MFSLTSYLKIVMLDDYSKSNFSLESYKPMKNRNLPTLAIISFLQRDSASIPKWNYAEENLKENFSLYQILINFSEGRERILFSVAF